jgi:hypothetical protein
MRSREGIKKQTVRLMVDLTSAESPSAGLISHQFSAVNMHLPFRGRRLVELLLVFSYVLVDVWRIYFESWGMKKGFVLEVKNSTCQLGFGAATLSNGTRSFLTRKAVNFENVDYHLRK